MNDAQMAAFVTHLNGELRLLHEKHNAVWARGKDGEDGEPGVGVLSAEFEGDRLRMTLTNGVTYESPALRGPQGESGAVGLEGHAGESGSDGVGIESVKFEQTKTFEIVLKITMTDGAVYTSPDLRGPMGGPGLTGAAGLAGPAGAAGATGPAGATGATGAKGDAGAMGATGATGATGTQIIPTTGAPSNATGSNGDYAIDSAEGVLYGPKTGGAWPSGVSFEAQKRWMRPSASNEPSASSSGAAGQIFAFHVELTRCQVLGISYGVGSGAPAGTVRAAVFGPLVTLDTMTGAPLVCDSGDVAQAATNSNQLVSLPPTTVPKGKYYFCLMFSSVSSTWYRPLSLTPPTGLIQTVTQVYGAYPSVAPSMANILVLPRPTVYLLTGPAP